MTLAIAKKEIIEILKQDGIVYERSTQNTASIMGVSTSYNTFHNELKEIFPDDYVSAIRFPISSGIFESTYFLASKISLQMAENLTKQFYANLNE